MYLFLHRHILLARMLLDYREPDSLVSTLQHNGPGSYSVHLLNTTFPSPRLLSYISSLLSKRYYTDDQVLSLLTTIWVTGQKALRSDARSGRNFLSSYGGARRDCIRT